MNEKEIQTIYSAIVQPLCKWYQANARDLPWRKDTDPYHVWLSEIMLQQTRVEAVKGYYARFLKQLPDIGALANADDEVLLKLWEGLGYYNRARNLKKAARVVMETCNGRFPSEYEQILALPGIGPYTAGAVASICFEQPTPAVDGNVLRVTARLTNDSRCVDTPAVKNDVAHRLSRVYPEGKCGLFTQALMELGAMVCIPNGMPKCRQCPVNTVCLANKFAVQDKLPVKAKKKPRKTEEITVFVLEHGGEIALRRRKQKGVLSGLLELPNTTGFLDETQAQQTAEQMGVQVEGIQKCIYREHIFTHIEWHMRCYFFRCGEKKNKSTGFIWADAEALHSKYTLPTAFKKILEQD